MLVGEGAEFALFGDVEDGSVDVVDDGGDAGGLFFWREEFETGEGEGAGGGDVDGCVGHGGVGMGNRRAVDEERLTCA